MAQNLLVIGNKRYSSWSLRGWLALKWAGIAFDEDVVPLYNESAPGRILRHGDGYPAQGSPVADRRKGGLGFARDHGVCRRPGAGKTTLAGGSVGTGLGPVNFR